jgi:hypothetical protein
MDRFDNNRLFIINDPNAPRLCPDLAVEIGLNESLLLLQMEYWLAVLPGKERDGKKWVYKSLRDIQKVFKFWGIATVHRVIKSLVEKEYLLVRSDLNARSGDTTQWFAINPTGINRLHSIKLVTHPESDLPATPRWNRPLHAGTDHSTLERKEFHAGATIPETSSETSSDISIEPGGSDTHKSSSGTKAKKSPPPPNLPPPEVVLYHKVCGFTPNRVVWPQIEAALAGRKAADILPYFKTWVEWGLKERGLGWLKWVVAGAIPSGENGHPSTLDMKIAHLPLEPAIEESPQERHDRQVREYAQQKAKEEREYQERRRFYEETARQRFYEEVEKPM